jgi:hypothetical protein
MIYLRSNCTLELEGDLTAFYAIFKVTFGMFLFFYNFIVIDISF